MLDASTYASKVVVSLLKQYKDVCITDSGDVDEFMCVTGQGCFLIKSDTQTKQDGETTSIIASYMSDHPSACIIIEDLSMLWIRATEPVGTVPFNLVNLTNMINDGIVQFTLGVTSIIK